MVQKKVFISREKNRRLLWKNGRLYVWGTERNVY